MTISKTPIHTALALMLAISAPLAMASDAGVLPAAASTDLVPARLVAAPPPAYALEREPVQFAWRLNPADALETQPAFVAESREYWTTVDAAELQRGLRIDTTAPGAVVRISPALGARPTPLDLDGFQLEVRGETLAPAQAFESAADQAALQAAGTDFPSGTVAFRLRPELGQGPVQLSNAQARGRYLVHVFEPQSSVTLQLGSDSVRVLNGGQLAVKARLLDGDRPMRADRIGGLLTAPDGRSVELDFDTARDGSLTADVALPAEASATPGLWELHAFVVHEGRGGQTVLRDARTAVSVVAPTARLAGGYRIDQADGVRVDFDVETASEGRYEVRAVLYGTDRSGRLRPMANAHSAAWLDAGAGALSLHFPKDVLGSGFRAPFELRELALSDQGRIGRLEQRATGLVIPARGRMSALR